ncbi:hypothetical protein [Vreelandella olivaria]|uniref:hypothetical protein n=1 Tax=Vreelandella olivaria TaxID=390919 RepID=UPI00201FB316|nr:hypothetical protein [Halomonas olivaria]
MLPNDFTYTQRQNGSISVNDPESNNLVYCGAAMGNAVFMPTDRAYMVAMGDTNLANVALARGRTLQGMLEYRF